MVVAPYETPGPYQPELFPVTVLQQGATLALDTPMALSAAKLSVELRLPMADSIILATAQARNATLWTQDVDFKNVEGVQYVERRS